jgi:hypothetical protein
MVKAMRMARPTIMAATMSLLVCTPLTYERNAGELGAPG